MEKLLEKLSSYNLFNYLLPGIIFVILLNAITFNTCNLIMDNIFYGAFLYYFIGLIISRFGSLVIEKLIQKIPRFKYASYNRYLKASEIDSTLLTFNEVNNMYRTFTSLFFILLLIKIFELFELNCDWILQNRMVIIIIILFFLFLFSYAKQISYIKKRIEYIEKKNNIEENN